MRLFVGIALDAGLANYLSGWSQRLAVSGSGGLRLIVPQYYHLTLAFLGSHPESVVPLLKQALSRVGSAHPPFACHLDGTALLPDKPRPRALVAKVEPTPQLLALRRDVCAGLEGLLPRGERHDFLPHITLARSGRRRPALAIEGLARNKSPLKAMLDVNAVTLYQSLRRTDGSHYRSLVKLALAGGENHGS